MSTLKQQLLNRIHDSDRLILDSSLFREPTKVVRLDYIGAPNYYITDKGHVYSRKDSNTNTAGILTRGYLPFTIMDLRVPYPWVRLPTEYGYYWFPVNQLLGWSFDPYPVVKPKAYVTRSRTYANNHHTDYEWIDELPSEGFFKNLLMSLYSDVK